VTSREFRERLAGRARKANVVLSAHLFEPLEAYYRLLTRRNERINLTALPLRVPTDTTLDRLLVEPIAAARFVPETRIIWFDLGSGGGSPAVPLKMIRPEARLTMVEAKIRKAAFLREAVRVLELPDTDVEDARFESLADRRETLNSADLVTVRAVKVDATLIRAAERLLRPHGHLLLFAEPSASRAQLKHAFLYEQTAKLAAGKSSHLAVFVRLG
jgi:16S rRNA (guanine527-N7)-methyltransferase